MTAFLHVCLLFSGGGGGPSSASWAEGRTGEHTRPLRPAHGGELAESVPGPGCAGLGHRVLAGNCEESGNPKWERGLAGCREGLWVRLGGQNILYLAACELDL